MNASPSRTLHRHPRRLRLLLTLATAVSAAGAASRPAMADDAQPPRYRIVGYVLGSRDADPRQIEASRLTHVNYAFANVRDGRAVLEWPERDGAHIAALQSLRARNPRLRILLSIGGGEWSSGFSDMARSEESRRAFTTSAVELLVRYAFDGLDIDWEYPGIPGPSTVYRPEDTRNFTLLLRGLREALDEQGRRDGRSGSEHYQLSIAANITEAYRSHVELSAIAPYLDFLNVMGYDNVGPWTERSGHHANLYPPDPATVEGSLPVLSVAAGVEGFLAAGVPTDKLVLGLAFYGFSFAGVDPQNRGLYHRFTGKSQAHSYAELQQSYIGKNGFTRFWDAAAKAPYLWNPETRTVISYDDPESHRCKVEYVRQKGLGGVMYWEHFQDPGQSLLLGLALGLAAP
jgi:chitinase